MKKPEEYYNDLLKWREGNNGGIQQHKKAILEVLKKAQTEAVEETCRVCAKEARMKHFYYDKDDNNDLYNKHLDEGFERCDGDGIPYGVDVLKINKESILSVADKLKEELN